jgi:hypothetical protein
MVTAIAALIGGPVTVLGAMYGTRGANRAAREGSAVTGFNSLTDQLQEELKEKRSELVTAHAEVATRDLEIARLRLMVQQLGGVP